MAMPEERIGNTIFKEDLRWRAATYRGRIESPSEPEAGGAKLSAAGENGLKQRTSHFFSGQTRSRKPSGMATFSLPLAASSHSLGIGTRESVDRFGFVLSPPASL